MSIPKLPLEDCVGCESCVQVCPCEAIEMIQNEEGFYYPGIIEGKCISCGACETSCPICARVNTLYHENDTAAVYAAWSLDEEMRRAGSSGGIFGELATTILERDGYVVGAAYKTDHTVEHRVIHTVDELHEIKKSKYLQSRANNSYKRVKELLGESHEVLYVGTPCQCAGLLTFLNTKPENLVLCDFICHGVNSPWVHQRYVCEVERSMGEKITNIDHRDKMDGWNNFQFSAFCGDKKQLLGNKQKNPYLRGFLTNLFLRKTCYDCRFKGAISPTDITLGDCWGYRGEATSGVSLLLVHTPGGQQLLDTVKKKIHLEPYSLEEAKKSNPSIVSSSQDRFKARSVFLANLRENKHSFESIIYEILGEVPNNGP